MFKVCVDVGGTFTDLVVLDPEGELAEFKSPSTPPDFCQGIFNVLFEAASKYSENLVEFAKKIELFIYGSTVATNAIVTRNVSKTGLITTKGFRDIIEMRRCLKIETKSMYEAFIPPYQPLVPRYLRVGVEEATKYTGEVITPVNEEEVKNALNFFKNEGVEAVAVCFINSYSNPENEQKVVEICKREFKNAFVTASTDILLKMGEYERFSTCVINACVGPIVSRHMANIMEMLSKIGFKGQLLILQANQLMNSVQSITKKPAYLIGSGPAAAPAGAVYLGGFLGEQNFITFDMGGTTCDVSLILNAEVMFSRGKWIGDDRLGLKIAEVTSIGAGGGSIAWVDNLGLLRVGPQSAAADPGPACYGKGGKNPTVTDAALILGYIPSDYFLGGKLKLDVEAAKSAINKIATKINMTIYEAAQAIFATVNSNMADAVAEISTKKGYDVRNFILLAVGGGGPLCGAFCAEILGIPKVIVPKFAASFCAWSMFTLDIGRDFVRTYICPVNDASVETINSLYEDMINEALNEFQTFNISKDEIILEKTADVRYSGQYHEIEMRLPAYSINHRDLEKLIQDFHQKHQDLYTFSLPWVPVEFRNLRLIVKIKSPKIKLKEMQKGTKDASEALKRKRLCYFNGNFVDTPIYDGMKLKFGNVIEGHAIIEEPTTTVVIPSDFHCRVDKYGNYILERR